MPTVLVIVGILLGGGIIAFGVILSRGQRSVVQERLGRYADGAIAAPQPTAAARPRQSPLGERLNEWLRRRSVFGKIHSELNAADIKINVGEFFALVVITTVGGALISVLAISLRACLLSPVGVVPCLLARGYGESLVFGAIGGVAGYFAPRIYIGMRKSARLKAFDNQLGDTLNLLVNALRSGYSVLQAMEAVSKELPPPISVEFRRVVQEIQLGLPMETALEHLLERISSEDLDLVVTAINIQREVGGNLAEILDVISYTIRERVRIKGEIATLTSQGMATGYAIAGMPFALMLLLGLVNPTYIGEFFRPQNQPCGWGMLIIALIMIGIGGAIIRKIVDIEI
ncbi:MAG: type II secretion system F family protein [Chloroflexi bacterium]|nr:type II secretion system F family protein [Chloroflexota bacterium]